MEKYEEILDKLSQKESFSDKNLIMPVSNKQEWLSFEVYDSGIGVNS